jgi:hypothetical protein
MEELVDKPTDEAAPKRNRGWFQKGDRRINLAGRPRVKPPVDDDGRTLDLAPFDGPLKLLYLSGRDLILRLSRPHTPWCINLPMDAEIVGSRADASGDTVVLVIRSTAFHWIAQGKPIPIF